MRDRESKGVPGPAAPLSQPLGFATCDLVTQIAVLVFRMADHSSRMRLPAAGGWPNRGRLRALSGAISIPPGLHQHQAGAHTALTELLGDLIVQQPPADQRKFSTIMMSLSSRSSWPYRIQRPSGEMLIPLVME